MIITRKRATRGSLIPAGAQPTDMNSEERWPSLRVLCASAREACAGGGLSARPYHINGARSQLSSSYMALLRTEKETIRFFP